MFFDKPLSEKCGEIKAGLNQLIRNGLEGALSKIDKEIKGLPSLREEEFKEKIKKIKDCYSNLNSYSTDFISDNYKKKVAASKEGFTSQKFEAIKKLISQKLGELNISTEVGEKQNQEYQNLSIRELWDARSRFKMGAKLLNQDIEGIVNSSTSDFDQSEKVEFEKRYSNYIDQEKAKNYNRLTLDSRTRIRSIWEEIFKRTKIKRVIKYAAISACLVGAMVGSIYISDNLSRWYFTPPKQITLQKKNLLIGPISIPTSPQPSLHSPPPLPTLPSLSSKKGSAIEKMKTVPLLVRLRQKSERVQPAPIPVEEYAGEGEEEFAGEEVGTNPDTERTLESYLNEARKYLKKDRARAIEIYTTALGYNNECLECSREIGFFNLENGNYATAEPHLKQAVELDTRENKIRYAQTLYGYARSLFEQKKFWEAGQVYEKLADYFTEPEEKAEAKAYAANNYRQHCESAIKENELDRAKIACERALDLTSPSVREMINKIERQLGFIAEKNALLAEESDDLLSAIKHYNEAKKHYLILSPELQRVEDQIQNLEKKVNEQPEKYCLGNIPRIDDDLNPTTINLTTDDALDDYIKNKIEKKTCDSTKSVCGQGLIHDLCTALKSKLGYWRQCTGDFKTPGKYLSVGVLNILEAKNAKIDYTLLPGNLKIELLISSQKEVRIIEAYNSKQNRFDQEEKVPLNSAQQNLLDNLMNYGFPSVYGDQVCLNISLNISEEIKKDKPELLDTSISDIEGAKKE